MARNWYGEKKINKEDMYTKTYVTNTDIRWEIIKIVIWIVLGILYAYFVVFGSPKLYLW